MPDRGGVWSDYFSGIRSQVEEIAGRTMEEPDEVPEVDFTEWDPDAERKLAAAALYEHSNLPDAQLLEIAGRLPDSQVAEILKAYVGDRSNRRHKPGRAFERSFYRFDILSDFGSFRDLQRHRMLTIDWQRLSPQFGHSTPGVIDENGLRYTWDDAMGRMIDLHEKLAESHGPEVAQYAVPFAFRLRYYMQFNVREAFHMLELRTAQQGHVDYRRICQEMHRLIREKAGHRTLADAMNYVDHEQYGLERLEAERRNEERGRSSNP